MQRASCYRAAATAAVVSVLLSLCLAAARPQNLNRVRRSGISDQRLAELETLIALARLKGRTKAITKPIAFGVIDPDKIGRRRKRHSLSYDDLVSILETLQQDITSLDNDDDEDQDSETDVVRASSPLASSGGGSYHQASPSASLQRIFRPSRSPDRVSWTGTA